MSTTPECDAVKAYVVDLIADSIHQLRHIRGGPKTLDGDLQAGRLFFEFLCPAAAPEVFNSDRLYAIAVDLGDTLRRRLTASDWNYPDHDQCAALARHFQCRTLCPDNASLPRILA